MVMGNRLSLNVFANILLVLCLGGCQAGLINPTATAIPSTTPTLSDTSTPSTTPTKTKLPTWTPRPPTLTPDFKQTGTAAAGPRSFVIKDLYDNKFISTTDAEYYRLDDMEANWAQLFWYKWWDTGFNAANFVLQADVEWDSASNIANWFHSGCGFVYNIQDRDNHNLIYLGMDGYAYSSRFEKGIYTTLPHGYYGKLKTPSDKGKLTLIVEDRWVTFLVNDKKAVHFEDTHIGSGNIATTLVSGTNKGYGTHCRFENLELWVLPETE